MRRRCLKTSVKIASAARLHRGPGLRLAARTGRLLRGGLGLRVQSAFTGRSTSLESTVVNILDTTQLLNTPLFAVFNNAIGIDNGAEMRLQDRLLQRRSLVVYLDLLRVVRRLRLRLDLSVPAEHNQPAALRASRNSRRKITTRRSYRAQPIRGASARSGSWFTTLQGNYGSGFPVAFEAPNVNLSGRLPAHTTFDLAAGRNLTPGRSGQDTGLGVQLILAQHPEPSVPDQGRQRLQHDADLERRPFFCSCQRRLSERNNRGRNP